MHEGYCEQCAAAYLETCKDDPGGEVEGTAEAIKAGWFFGMPGHGGAIIIQGNEVHMGVLPAHRFGAVRFARQVLAKALPKVGALVAPIHNENHKAIRLAVALGFKPIAAVGDAFMFRRT